MWLKGLESRRGMWEAQLPSPQHHRNSPLLSPVKLLSPAGYGPSTDKINY